MVIETRDLELLREPDGVRCPTCHCPGLVLIADARGYLVSHPSRRWPCRVPPEEATAMALKWLAKRSIQRQYDAAFLPFLQHNNARVISQL